MNKEETFYWTNLIDILEHIKEHGINDIKIETSIEFKPVGFQGCSIEEARENGREFKIYHLKNENGQNIGEPITDDTISSMFINQIIFLQKNNFEVSFHKDDNLNIQFIYDSINKKVELEKIELKRPKSFMERFKEKMNEVINPLIEPNNKTESNEINNVKKDKPSSRSPY